MPSLSSIQTPCGSEVSLSSLLSIEGTLRKRVEAQNGKKNDCSNDTLDTESCSDEWTSWRSQEPHDVVPKSILKKTNNKSIECKNDEQLKSSWIEQPIPSPPSSPISRRRRRTSNQTSPSKYDGTKTRFPGREERRRRQEPTIRRSRTEKTVEEQWVRTCRFLW